MTARLGRLGRIAAAAALLAGCGGAPQPAPTASAGTVVPMPAAVLRWGAPRFVPGAGQGVVLDFAGNDGVTHAGYVRADGSGFRCLTCGPGFADLSIGRPAPFGDGHRVLVQSPAASNGIQKLSFLVIECAGSVASCAHPVVRAVTGTQAPDSLQDRVGLISPDGSTLVWTRIRRDGFLLLAGRLTRAGAGYQVRDIRVLNAPADRAATDVAGLARADAWYEAKSFAPDGQSITFAATIAGSLNLDSYLMDLRTGAVRRLTDDPDWDEGLEISPDGRSFAQASSRGGNITAAFGNLPRPPVLDLAAITVLNYFTPRRTGATEPYRRGAQRQPYVFGIVGEPDGHDAVALATASDTGWYVNDWPDWSADGSLLVWAQARPARPEIRQVRTARAPVRPGPPVRAVATPSPHWAPAISAVPVAAPGLRRVIAGPDGGNARVEMTGDLLAGFFAVTYVNYRDGCTVLDGHQTVRTDRRLDTTYREKLTMTGCHTGTSTVDVVVHGAQGAGQGSATSTYDGRTRTTTLTPTPATSAPS
ncbi:MAG: hypothetical protein V7603_2224 [Micromonosporaceae bacterium]